MTGIEAPKIALDNRQVEKPSTRGIINGLEICVYNNNSKFDQDCPLQTNDRSTRTPNFCSYADLQIYKLDKLIKE